MKTRKVFTRPFPAIGQVWIHSDDICDEVAFSKTPLHLTILNVSADSVSYTPDKVSFQNGVLSYEPNSISAFNQSIESFQSSYYCTSVKEDYSEPSFFVAAFQFFKSRFFATA